MSFFNLLFLQARLTGRAVITDINLFADDSVFITNFNLPIPFSLSDLPDIVVGSTASSATGNNFLVGTTTPNPVTFTLPTITQVINSGGDLGGPYTIVIPDSGASPPIATISFPLPNTADEALFGFGGNDTLSGLSGNDALFGDGLTPNEGGVDGSDSLLGGDGEDVLVGGDGGDVLSGGNQGDFILGDYFLGLTNASIPINVNRFISSGSESFEFLGTGAAYSYTISVNYSETIQFGSGTAGGNDTIFGGSGEDVILADRGNDTVFGDADADAILGGAGSDTLRGGTGNDAIFGDSLSPGFAGPDDIDVISGDEDDDFLVGGGLGDSLDGGLGNDVLLGDYYIGLFSGTVPLQASFQIPVNIPVLPTDTTVLQTIQVFVPGASLPIGSGNEGNDTLVGGFGDDLAIGDKGSDQISLGFGTDVGIGGAGADFINGGFGDDFILGDFVSPNFLEIDGADTLLGEEGVDVIVGGGGGDSITGGLGDDVLLGDYFLGFLEGVVPIDVGPLPPGFSVVPSGPKPDTIYLPIGSGNEGNDTIDGNGGNDVLIGDKGNDTLRSSEGNNLFIGASGADSIQGGVDDDVILGDLLAPNLKTPSLDGSDIISSGGGVDVVLAGGGGDSVLGGGGNDVLFGDYLLGLFGLEIPIEIGEPFADVVLPIGSGNEGNDTIRGGDGDDFVVGDKGFDQLFGDAGEDVILGGANADGISGGTEDDIILGDLLAPNAYGPDGIDTINAGDGQDVVVGGGLGDLIDGGSGNDFILGDYFSNLPIKSPILIPLTEDSEGLQSISSAPQPTFPQFIDTPVFASDLPFAGDLALPDIQLPIGSGNEGNDTILAGTGDDFVLADKGQDSVLGQDGNDVLLGGSGNDTLTGGSGDDVISGDYVLPQGTAIPLDPDTARSLENFVELTEADELVIDAGPAGDDLLEGGAGNDVLLGDEGTDTATYANDPGAVNISLGNIFNPGIGTGTDGYGNTDILIGIENLIGSDFNDILNGDDKANVITGGVDNDILSGLGGNDTLLGQEGGDFIVAGDGDDSIVGGIGADYIDGGNGVDISSYSESDFGVRVDIGQTDIDLVFSRFTSGQGFSGDARGDILINVENLEGSQFVDQLYGTNGANLILGLNGDDQIFGRAGNDTLYGGLGNDIIRAGLGNDILYGAEGLDNLFGDAGDDFIYGGADFDELTGGDGNDRIFGEDGIDRLFGGNGDDQLSGGLANDTLYGGFGVDYLDGGDDADLLSGDDSNDVLVGGNGGDTLRGGTGNDWLDGGLGIDHYYGNSGKDLFVLARDIITGENVRFAPIFDDDYFDDRVPFVAPGSIDTIYDFQNTGQWWEFGGNIDQIGLRDGITFNDLVFLGVSTVQGSGISDSTVIGYYGFNESFGSLALVVALTPDKFKPTDFVTV